MSKGQRIKSQREKLNISQTDLAKKVSISKQTLYKYENDIITNIPSDVIENLSRYLECTPGYIMGWEGDDTTTDSDRLLHKFNRLNNNGKSQLMDYADFLLSKDELKKEGIEEKEMCS